MKLVVLTTPTCIKCKSYKEIAKKVSENLGIDLEIRNALDDINSSIIKTYNVRSVPFTLLYKENEVVKVYKDTMTESELLSFIED